MLLCHFSKRNYFFVAYSTKCGARCLCISIGETTIGKTLRCAISPGIKICCSLFGVGIQSGLILAKSLDLQSSSIAPIFNTCLLDPTETH